jgi:hypothetical protein
MHFVAGENVSRLVIERPRTGGFLRELERRVRIREYRSQDAGTLFPVKDLLSFDGAISLWLMYHSTL